MKIYVITGSKLTDVSLEVVSISLNIAFGCGS